MAYAALTAANAKRWAAMTILPGRKAGLDANARRILSHKDVYQAVERKLVSLGHYVPWWAIGVIHLREADLNMNAQLAQGDPLSRRSVHVPAGRGPFLGPDAFLRGCLDALIDCAPHTALWHDWSSGGTATAFELYNGLGYANMGRPSPYNWSGSDQYRSGKYVSDGVYSSTAVDVQPGCMAVLRSMMALDPSIHFPGATTSIPTAPPKSPSVTHVDPPAPKPTLSWRSRAAAALDAFIKKVI